VAKIITALSGSQLQASGFAGGMVTMFSEKHTSWTSNAIVLDCISKCNEFRRP
jgi:hypothetical protein